MKRREFNRLCTAMLAGASSHSLMANEQTLYPRTQLMYENDSPVTVASMQAGSSCIFSYPYVTTPCFLVRLKKIAEPTTQWQGGVGADSSVVAFSAICSHKMSHPAKPISHINFRQEPISFYSKDGKATERDQLISCCSERSVYDPAKGGEVLSGPAPAPLAAIVLEEAENGELFAIGSAGTNVFDQFLDKFGFRLALEYGVSDVRAPVGSLSIATPAESFSAQQIRC